MVAALASYGTCTNLESDDKADLKDWIELANESFAAGRKVALDTDAQNAIALACRRATRSVEAAAERCKNGPRPKWDR
ncbi:MAG: hypothetical protein AB7P03_14200 [Kofleriaceae bacterium]